MEDEKCPICESTFKDSENSNWFIANEKEIATLCVSSKKREDQLWEKFKIVKPLRLHKICSAFYNLGRDIPRESKESSLSATAISDVNFNFKDLCFLCFNKTDRSHKKVLVVTKETFQLTIESVADKRKDTWGQKVREILDSNPPLMLLGAQYHRKCYSNFHHFGQSNPVGRPKDPQVQKAFIDACNYIENNSDSEFTLPEIMDELEYKPKGTYLLNTLKEHYKDDLYVLSRQGRPTILCFRDATRAKLLESSYMETEKIRNAALEQLRIAHKDKEKNVKRPRKKQEVLECDGPIPSCSNEASPPSKRIYLK